MGAQGGVTAIVVGATGLVGAELVQQLLEDAGVVRVVTLVRRASGVTHEKLSEHIIDFEAPARYADLVRGDVLYSALGTTLRRAGSQAAQYRVDHTYQLRVAALAAESGVGTFVLISAMGADPKSPLFYSRMKGELERDVAALGFESLVLVRPGPLDGPRTEHRRGESFFLKIARRLPRWDALAPLRAQHASLVARAARRLAGRRPPGTTVLAPVDIFREGEVEATNL